MNQSLSKPLVSVISINYNGLQETMEMIASLKKISYPNIEIIIVDNDSKEDPTSIKSSYPDVVLFRNPINEGFAGGNNRGMEIATGDYFVLLNNDTLVDPNFLEPLVERAQSDPTIGIICPKLVYFEDQSIIQYAGYTPINPITGRGHGIGFNEKDKGQYNTAQVTDRAHGAAMFIPRKAVEKTGLMAELYFLYYEEMDYCERIKRNGFTIWYEPGSRIIHKESMSVGKNSLMKTFYMSRNRLIYLRRNVPYPLFLVTLAYYLLVAAPKNLLTHILHREFAHAKAYLQGLLWHLTPRNIHNDKALYARPIDL
jgi:GT2 family glycosyltransferase